MGGVKFLANTAVQFLETLTLLVGGRDALRRDLHSTAKGWQGESKSTLGAIKWVSPVSSTTGHKIVCTLDAMKQKHKLVFSG